MHNGPLYTRHDEIPMLSSRAGKVDAIYYNHVQTALKHLGSQIRLSIPELRHLDLILQKDAWIIVDITLNDVPVLAWTCFETKGRLSLHEPIHCEIRFFHYAAPMILKRSLEAMDVMLNDLLQKNLPDKKTEVTPIHKG